MNRTPSPTVFTLTLALLLAMAGHSTTSGATPSISQEPFGEHEGKTVTVYTLENGAGLKAEILDLGGIIFLNL